MQNNIVLLVVMEFMMEKNILKTNLENTDIKNVLKGMKDLLEWLGYKVKTMEEI